MHKMHVKKTVAENLPPGWIKEIRTKRTKGKTRSDPYYIDPDSGRQFRSMQEVFRYLKSKDSGKAESKPDEGHSSMEVVDNFQSLSAEAKEQRSIDKRKDKNVADQKSIKSGPDAAVPKNIEKPLVGEKHREDDSVADKYQNKVPQANFEELGNGGRRKSMRLANNKPKDDAKEYLLQSGSETAAENNMNIPESKGLEHREKKNSCTAVQHENPAPQRKSTKRKWMNNTPRRTSKRLASLEVNQAVEVKNSDKDGASAKLLSEGEVNSIKNASTFREANEPEAVKSCTTEIDKKGREVPTNDKQKEAITDKKNSSEEQKSTDAVSQEDQKHLDFSLKEILMDPCIEFAIKMLTGAIPIEDVTKSDSNPVSSSNQTSSCSTRSPCSDIWSDPCFEFAVKTLTGEMPTEDSLRVDKPVNSSGGSVCPSNYPFTTKSAATATTNKVYPPSTPR